MEFLNNWKQGGCRFGDRCKFSHEPESKGTKFNKHKKEEKEFVQKTIIKNNNNNNSNNITNSNNNSDNSDRLCVKCHIALPLNARFCLSCGNLVFVLLLDFLIFFWKGLLFQAKKRKE